MNFFGHSTTVVSTNCLFDQFVFRRLCASTSGFFDQFNSTSCRSTCLYSTSCRVTKKSAVHTRSSQQLVGKCWQNGVRPDPQWACRDGASAWTPTVEHGQLLIIKNILPRINRLACFATLFKVKYVYYLIDKADISPDGTLDSRQKGVLPGQTVDPRQNVIL